MSDGIEYKSATGEFSFRLKQSKIEGVGVFALHAITRGTKLALKPDDYISRRLNKDQVPEELRGLCVKHDKDTLRCPQSFNRPWLCWFLNHSDAPNAKGDDDDNFVYYATRNIEAGEEITIDYETLDEDDGLD